jgi:multidrug efflux pump subunit AcrA (membrane-fusion protein)
MRKILAVVFAAAVIAAAGLSCKKDHPSTAEHEDTRPAIEAGVMTVARQPMPDMYEAVGTVRAGRRSTLSAKVMGPVLSVAVQQGDRVAAGQELVIIEARDIDAQVRQAQAGQAQAMSGLSEVDAGIAATEAGMAAARADADLASKTYDRFRQLYDEKSVSRQEFDQVKAQRDKALAGLQAAEKQVKAMKAKRGQVTAQMAQAQAQADQARVMRGYAVITAPYAGVVAQKIAEEGQMAAPGMPLLVIEEDTDLRLEAAVDESRIGNISPGETAEVAIDALGGKTLEGVVVEIAPSGDAASRSFIVKVGLPREPGLLSGMFGRARFVSGETEKILIPSSALVAKGALQGVFVLDSQSRARFRVVRTGEAEGRAQVEVYSGLTPGEKIVTGKAAGLSDGRKVKER